MRQKLSIRVGLCLILSLLLSCFYMPITQAAGVSPFTDIDESHWGFKNVIKLQCRGVIAGYSDKTYKPDNMISQVEAVILAVRNLAQSEEVSKMEKNQDFPFTIPEWASNNNKQELLYALKIGLLNADGSDFKATQAATRAWFTKLIIRMCALTAEAQSSATAATNFKDDSDIADDARGSINVAVKKGIIAGYADGTFLPKKYVTRVEAASILGRCESYLDLTNSVKTGTITNIVGSMLTLQAGGYNQNVLLVDSTWLFDENGKRLSTSALKVGDNLKYVMGNTNVLYAEKTSEAVAYISSYKTNTTATTTTSETAAAVPAGVSGSVVYVSAEDNMLVIRKTDGSLLTGTTTATTQIQDIKGTSIQLSDIPTDGLVSVIVSGNTISSLVLQTSIANGSIEKQGTIYRLIPEQKLFMLQTNNGVETYQYTVLLDVVIPGKNVASMSDLKVGDQVRVKVDSGVMQTITLITSSDGTTLSGTIELMPSGSDLFIINVGGEKKIYTVSNKATVVVPGNSAATLNSLKVGDAIRFVLSEGAITKIEVENRLVGSDLEGTVKAIDTKENILVLQTSSGVTYSYPIKDKARILLDSEEADLYDIEVGDTVSITLYNEEINTITALKGTTGIVTSVDPTRMLIGVAASANSTSKTYPVAVSPEIDIEGVSKATLSSVHVGDTVRMEMENDVVESIEVQRTIPYSISGIKESTSRVVVVSSTGASRTLYIKSSVELVVPDVAYPNIYDLEVGDQVDVTYMGSVLKKIEVIPSTTGQITSLDTEALTFVVRTYEGVTKTFNFSKNATIIHDSTHGSKSESGSLATLTVGDRVIVLTNTSGDMTIYHMDKIEGTFVSILTDTEQLRMIANPLIINRTYGLYSQVYLHQGAINLSWSNFNVNDSIAVYLHESQIYEVEKQ